MGDVPLTRPSLLLQLRDATDSRAWGLFVDRYGPLVYHFARQRGLQDADAADVTQEVLGAVAGAIARLDYDPARGTFRAWLLTVVRHHLLKYWRKQRQLTRGTGDTSAQLRLQAEPDPREDDEALWDQEYERQLYAQAAARIRGCFEPGSWQAFWLTAVEGQKAHDVAQCLGISIGAVYTAKSRVLDRIKKEIRQLRCEEE